MIGFWVLPTTTAAATTKIREAKGVGNEGRRKGGRGLNEQNGTKPYLNWEAFPNIGGEQNGNVVAGKLKSQERSELDRRTDRGADLNSVY